LLFLGTKFKTAVLKTISQLTPNPRGSDIFCIKIPRAPTCSQKPWQH